MTVQMGYFDRSRSELLCSSLATVLLSMFGFFAQYVCGLRTRRVAGDFIALFFG